MRWLLFVSLFLFSCASVKEIEEHSKRNTQGIEGLFREGGRPEVTVRPPETRIRPVIVPSEWIRVWRGSFYVNGSVTPEGWMFIRLKEEEPETHF